MSENATWSEMLFVGIDPSRNVGTVALVDADVDSQRLRTHSKLDVHGIVDLLKEEGLARLVLVAIEEGPAPLPAAFIDPLMDSLTRAHIPHISVNTAMWKSVHHVALKPTEKSKAEARQFVASQYNNSDLLGFSEHAIDATAIALYARTVAWPRAKDRDTNKPGFKLQAPPLLWRHWPEFQQRGYPALYVELLRQTSPQEALFGTQQTAKFAGIPYKRFWKDVDILAAEGLLTVPDRTQITLIAPWERTVKEVTPTRPPRRSEREQLVFLLDKAERHANRGDSSIPYLPSEVEDAILNSLLGRTNATRISSYYRYVLHPQTSLEGFPPWQPEVLSYAAWRGTREAIARVLGELPDDARHPGSGSIPDREHLLSTIDHHLADFETIRVTKSALARRRLGIHAPSSGNAQQASPSPRPDRSWVSMRPIKKAPADMDRDELLKELRQVRSRYRRVQKENAVLRTEISGLYRRRRVGIDDDYDGVDLRDYPNGENADGDLL